MKSALSAAAVALMLASLVVAQPRTTEAGAKRQQITFMGCVASAERDTYTLAPVMRLLEPAPRRVPEFAHGRQVFFWLDDEEQIRRHIGRMVEVRGEFSAIETSEVELKSGRHRDGGLIVEFEGPGRDVRTSAAAAGVAIGTGGATAEKDDIKAYLLRVDVKSVRATGTC